MATNNFNSDPTNDSFEPLMSYFDSQGVNRLESANISSYGFDGFIPIVIQNRTASGILPGMAISLTGSSTGQNFYKVLSNNVGDREFTASPSNDIVIEYLDNDQLVQVLSASVNDIFSVSYENWDGKDLGSTGWYLGNSGNAIFSNVAVRGRIEATEGVLEGDLTLGGSLTASNNNGLLQVSSSGIFGTASGNSLIYNNITGQVSISGEVIANSGKINDLDIGPNQSSVLNIIGVSTPSAAFSSSMTGLFIMTSTEYRNNIATQFNRKLKRGDVFKLTDTFSTSSYSHGFINESNQLLSFEQDTYVSASVFHPQLFRVLTASYSEYDSSILLPGWGTYSHFINRYLCQIVTPPINNHPSGNFFNFDGVSASSGSFTIGYVFIGQDNYFDLNNGIYTLEGISLENYKSGNSPDFIDLSGDFKLGSGNLTFNNNTLSVIGSINAISGSISGNLRLGGSLTASTNNGFLSLSSSGIYGSTASGSILFNNITGKLQVSGNITANKGNIKELLIGAGVSYNILNIIGTASVSDAMQSGNFILTTSRDQKSMGAGNYFYIDGSSVSGNAFLNGSPIAKPNLIFNSVTKNSDTRVWSSTYVFYVVTASLDFNSLYNRYFCRLSQEGIFNNYDFSQLTASSGSINMGYAYTGEFSGYSGPSSPLTKIDGIILNVPTVSNFWGNNPPDHIDITGKIRLGAGRLTYDSNVLNVSGFLKNSQKNVVDITASAYTLTSTDAWSRLDVSSTASTVIIIPVAFNAIFDNKTEIDFIQCGSGSVIFAIQTTTSASLNSFLNRRTLSGQWTTAKLTAKSLNNWILTGNIL